jgi:putative ABC transport system permease protein
MMAWLKMGFRNLIKNARRSMITAMAISLAFGTVNLFDGFATYMHRGNQAVAIYAMAQGHLAIFKKGFLEKGRLEPGKYLLTSNDVAEITKICATIPAVEMVTPQLSVNGLLSNGRISTIFLAQGMVPSAREAFLRHLEKMAEQGAAAVGSRFEGEPMRDDKTNGVAVSRGLAKILGLKVGDDAVTFGSTQEGQMNALDSEVMMIFNAGTEQMNDKIMVVPYAFAQTLYDTTGADHMAILLRDTDKTEEVRDEILKQCSARGIDAEMQTWVQMSEWYRKVKAMFDTIFQFLFFIVFIIVVMSVVNTMGMSVMERTREIGTLRAMGLKRRGVLMLFAVESMLLGMLGTMGGLFVTFLGWALVKVLKPTWNPPGMSNRFVIWIEWVPHTLLFSFIFMLLLCLIASLLPARRAAHQNIVDALGHV